MKNLLRIPGSMLIMVVLINHHSLSFPLFKINRFDKSGERCGKWYFYFDKEKGLLSSKGKFTHGKPTGKWKYYSSDGHLQRKEKYNRTQTVIKTTYYHTNGKVECKGLARIKVDEDNRLHYFWDGPWNYYDDKGKLVKTVVYDITKEPPAGSMY